MTNKIVGIKPQRKAQPTSRTPQHKRHVPLWKWHMQREAPCRDCKHSPCCCDTSA